MSLDPHIPADDGGDDALAAEYVLGVLDQDERLRAATRIARDPAFARLVERWEVEFGGLNGQFAEVTPPRALKAKVNALIFAEPERAPLLGSAMWSSLAFWRALSAAAVAGLALLAFFAITSPVPTLPGQELVALIAPEKVDARFVAIYDTATHDLRVTRVAGDRPAGKDHELWLVGADGKPVSLGVIGAAGPKAPAVAEGLRAQLNEGAVLAVSLEEEGGSVTGAPAEVLGVGTVKKI
jgi:anti-sigma-K factor RskA